MSSPTKGWASGTHGFGAVLVKDRFHAGGHGQYFDPKFVERYWEPFVSRGEYRGTEFETTMPTTPWWTSMLGILPLKWLAVALLIALATLPLYFQGAFHRSHAGSQPAPSGESAAARGLSESGAEKPHVRDVESGTTSSPAWDRHPGPHGLVQRPIMAVMSGQPACDLGAM
jgi:hypothetical protein